MRFTRLDDLTELPGGVLLFDRLTQAIAGARGSGNRLGLLFLSIDNFRETADTLGNAMGEQVLKLAAQRLDTAIGRSGGVCQHHGNEFVIALTAVSRAGDAIAIAVADSIIAALASPHLVSGAAVRLKTSIGISFFPDDGEAPDGLIDRAAAGMYRARRDGLGSYHFQGEVPTSARSLELRAAESLREAFGTTPDNEDSRSSLQREANQNLLLAALLAHERLADAETANRRQIEFMGIVAHELRGPLAPISNAAALLGRIRTQEPLLPMVKNIIERQLMHLTRLVADLLDTTRIDTGKMRLEMRRLDIVELIDVAIKDLQPAVLARHQELYFHLPPPDILVNGDRLRLTQVVTNLIGNASKYTQPGGQIAVSAKVVGRAVSIEVSDNGIGITADQLPHVFDPFVQERRATEFDRSGLGIGLTVVRELVEGHGGRVEAESAGRGSGSRFTVTLPLVQASELTIHR